ncbi:hypothetical protein J5N97_008530 [Dioscorea zingiberensis]|uniref:Polyamine transporter PUT1 n=1 Tax=Dioscorea zingiberensis TaxID=325984 RepID=A0A9D5CXU2_9LILI|nr:hypothetical protein J5N97_008530 [Dioscorea zingiberensis]
MGPVAAHGRKPPSSPAKRTGAKLTTLPLIALIFYDVSGGPFGLEDSVRAGAGPLLPLLGLLVFPVLWSLPEALITAELASSLPSNAGYVLWVSSAFGPFLAFQEGLWKWASGAMDNALYPVLFLDYLRPSLPFFSSGAGRFPTLWALTAALTCLNYRGLHVVGISAVLLTVFSLSPFIALVVLSLPRLRPRRWLAADLKRVDLRGYFNSMLWNLNYWDKASTLAGEVEDPARAFPKAVFGALVLVVASYLLPLLAGTGAMEGMKSGEWGDGYFAEVGMAIGGAWLKWWIQAAAAMSNMGLFEAEMSGDSFQLLGMSELGMLPAFFSSRSKYGTPTISILFSATGVIFLSWMSFQEIIEFLNFLYALGMLLEFAAFIQLRIKRPDLHRPYKVPVGTFGAVVICIPPTALLILVMCLASARTFIVSGIVMLIGFVLYPAIQFMKDKQWVRFIDPSVPLESCFGTIALQQQEVPDEASLSLLPEFSSIKEEPPGDEPDLERVLKSK